MRRPGWNTGDECLAAVTHITAYRLASVVALQTPHGLKLLTSVAGLSRKSSVSLPAGSTYLQQAQVELLPVLHLIRCFAACQSPAYVCTAEAEDTSMAIELGKLECNDMSCSKPDLLRGVIGYGLDPAQITSPVKRTPLPEAPADDGFHRTFQPFHMLKSPTSLGGHSFQDLNAHLAQNARLSTRQRSLRHSLRTATKEYVMPEEPALPGSL